MGETKPRVFGWLADHAGCGYYRVKLPLAELRAQGQISCYWDTIGHYRDLEQYDVIVGQRVSSPGASSIWRRLAEQHSRLMVYELDDDLWHVDPTNPVYGYYSNPTTQRALVENIRVADLVTVTTQPLADLVRRHNPNVVVLPNWVDQRLLELPHSGQAEGVTRIGWAGSSTHQADFQYVREPLRRALRSIPTAQLRFLGADHSAEFTPTPSIHIPWVHGLDEYYQTLAGLFDVAIAPLRPGVFNRSKSDIRAKELHALGIPAVYTPGHPYGDVVQHGVTGMLAHRMSDWGVHLRALARDPEMRVEMGQAARKLAEGWTIQRNAHTWLDAYREAM